MSIILNQWKNGLDLILHQISPKRESPNNSSPNCLNTPNNHNDNQLKLGARNTIKPEIIII